MRQVLYRKLVYISEYLTNKQYKQEDDERNRKWKQLIGLKNKTHFQYKLCSTPKVTEIPENIFSDKYYHLLDKYNHFTEYNLDLTLFGVNIQGWNVCISDMNKQDISIDLKIAIQLHILSKSVEFPSFIKTRSHNLKVSVGRLWGLLPRVKEGCRNLLESRLCVLMSMECSKTGKYGKALTYLMEAHQCLQHTEASEFQAWYCLAWAIHYDTLRRCHPRGVEYYRNMIYQMLDKSYRYFVHDKDSANLHRLESMLIWWWMFIVKSNLIDVMPRLMSDQIDLLTVNRLCRTLTKEQLLQADKMFVEFQHQMEQSNWLPMRDKYIIYQKVRDIIKEMRYRFYQGKEQLNEQNNCVSSGESDRL